MFILGLTGPSGAGKSLISRHLEQRGFGHVDADKVARNVVEPGKPCLADLAAAFGSSIIRTDGSLDRKRLAKFAFEGGKVSQLNAITYPYIISEIERRLAELENSGARFTVLDVPALYEIGADRLCNRVMAVTAGRDLRIKRIIARDGITREQAEARINVQPDDAFYKERVDYLVSSDNGETELLSSVDSIIDMILAVPTPDLAV